MTADHPPLLFPAPQQTPPDCFQAPPRPNVANPWPRQSQIVVGVSLLLKSQPSSVLVVRSWPDACHTKLGKQNQSLQPALWYESIEVVAFCHARHAA